QFRRLETVGFQIGLWIVCDESGRSKIVQTLQRFGDAAVISAGLDRARYFPCSVGYRTLELDHFRAVRDDDAVEGQLAEIHQCCVAPFLYRSGNEFQQVRAHDIDALDPDHPEENLITRHSFIPDEDLSE